MDAQGFLEEPGREQQDCREFLLQGIPALPTHGDTVVTQQGPRSSSDSAPGWARTLPPCTLPLDPSSGGWGWVRGLAAALTVGRVKVARGPTQRGWCVLGPLCRLLWLSRARLLARAHCSKTTGVQTDSKELSEKQRCYFTPVSPEWST